MAKALVYGEVVGSDEPIDPSYGIPSRPPHAGHPLPIPPEPPGTPEHPIVHPPGVNIPIYPTQPIFIPAPPDAPPGVIWPPLPPDIGASGKTLIFIWVPGVGSRWYVYDAPTTWPPQPPTAQPKIQ
jgi:hypothetical protein